jgi:hypothetical protein
MSGVISLEVSHPSGSPEPFQVIMMEDAWVGTLRDQNVLLDGGGWAGFLFLDEPGVFSEVALCIAPPELPEQVAVKVEIRDSGAGFSVAMAAYIPRSNGMEAVLNSCMDGASSAGVALLTKLSERSHLPILTVHPRTGTLLQQDSFPIPSEVKDTARDALVVLGDEPVPMTYQQHLRASADMQRHFAGGNLEEDVEQHTQGERIGRNDPCPCESGKKYKKCCGGVA